MPYAVPNRSRTLPRPAPARPGRAVRVSGGAGASVAQVIYPWNFGVRVWLSFDPPTAAYPTWMEVTGYIDMEQPITINRGRADGVSDVNAATLSMTADNSDGRWCANNPAGAWSGLIRKGAWLKIDILPPSGLVSDRYVGFINTLPTTWDGLYASSQIGASDRYERLGQAPTLISAIQSEVLTDPNLAGNVKGYWNLHETPSLVYGAYNYGDTSGQGAASLRSVSIGGVPNGYGLTASNATGPGFDGIKAPSFTPPSAGKGTVLTGTIAAPPGTWDIASGGIYTGLLGTLEMWFQAVTTNTTQVLAAIVDPVANFAISLYYDATGKIRYAGVGTTPSNPITYFSFTAPVVASRVDDGAWHHVVLGVAATGASGGSAACLSVQDGYWLASGGAGTSAGIPGGIFTQLVIGGGYDPAAPGVLTGAAANICDVAWTWADVNDIGALEDVTSQRPPNYAAHYAAGSSGNLGESTDQRVARVARYAGIPAPYTYITDSYSLGDFIGQVAVYSPGTAPWTNLAPGAHSCGTQAMGVRAALDVMREAARTENMPLFIDRHGYLTLQPSTLRQNTSPAWTVDARDLDPSTALADDFAYMTNQATVTPNGQAAQTVVGGPGSPGALSQAKYGIYSSGGLISTASLTALEAQNLGLAVIAPRADPAPRWAPLAVEGATLATQPGYGTAWLDAVLATEISTAIRVTNLPAAAGGGTADMLIEGWTETITGGNLLFAFSTSPVQGPTYQLDSPSLGLLDTPGVTLAY